MRFLSKRAESSNSSLQITGDLQSLQSSAEFTLDFAPLKNETTAIQVEIETLAEEQEHRFERLFEMASESQATIKNIENTSIVTHRCLQGFEKQLDALTERNTLQNFMRPLARSLLQLRRKINSLIELPENSNLLLVEVDQILGDFGLALICPAPGEPFDPHTMRPRCDSVVTGKPSSCVVGQLVAPGARFGDQLLQLAEVLVTDRLDNPSQQTQDENLSADLPVSCKDGLKRRDQRPSEIANSEKSI